jgi:2-polyprenyl-3-methyl-5-hydroxy-6-metoxy-1,4-benzoquinol methylase
VRQVLLRIAMYDQFADIYAEMVRDGSPKPFIQQVALQLLERAGDVGGLEVLDAGCGEGHAARLFARFGARVTAMDISPRLIELARAHEDEAVTLIDFQVFDLTQPLPRYRRKFDLAIASMVLDDVGDHSAFIRTVSDSLQRGGRFLLSMNNPYSAVPREKVPNYYETGTIGRIGGFEQAGIYLPYHHRTMQDYVATFRDSGFLISGLGDVKPPDGVTWDVPHQMILELVRQ